MSNIADINKKIIDSIADSILLINREYEIVFANKAMLQLCGQKEEDVIGQKCNKFSHHRFLPCHKESITDFVCPHFDVFKTGDPMSVTHAHILPDGAERIFDITASPIKH